MREVYWEVMNCEMWNVNHSFEIVAVREIEIVDSLPKEFDWLTDWLWHILHSEKTFVMDPLIIRNAFQHNQLLELISCQVFDNVCEKCSLFDNLIEMKIKTKIKMSTDSRSKWIRDDQTSENQTWKMKWKWWRWYLSILIVVRKLKVSPF
jgi:hypothetical protein